METFLFIGSLNKEEAQSACHEQSDACPTIFRATDCERWRRAEKKGKEKTKIGEEKNRTVPGRAKIQLGLVPMKCYLVRLHVPLQTLVPFYNATIFPERCPTNELQLSRFFSFLLFSPLSHPPRFIVISRSSNLYSVSEWSCNWQEGVKMQRATF